MTNQMRKKTVIESKSDFIRPAGRRFRILSLGNRECRIRSLTAGEMRSFRSSLSNAKGELIRKRADRLQELLIAQCLATATGDRILADEDVVAGDFDLLDGGEIATLFAACKDHTGFGADADWTAIEDAAKNSDPTSTN